MSTRAFLCTLLSRERDLFAQVIRAVPQERLDYQPDSKARTARQLVEHLLGHHLDLAELVTDGSLHHRNHEYFDSLGEATERLDEAYAAILDATHSLSDEEWGAAMPYYVEGDYVMDAPRERLAWMLYLGAVHHRGQLSTYLRPMGSAVPAIYGPSADDPGSA
jgi:uncharacterized damage-inducible protein DinB